MKVSRYVVAVIIVSLIISNIFLAIRVHQLREENKILKEGLREAVNHIFDFIRAVQKYCNDTELIDYVTESNFDFWNWYWHYKHLLQ